MKFRRFLVVGIIFIGIAVTAYAVYANYGKDRGSESFIMAFGDSLTYGQGDRKEQGYVGKLERELNKKYPERKFIVENHGVKGRESAGVLKELAIPSTAVKLKKADYFILYIGTNDLINSNGGNLKKIDKARIEKGKERYFRNVKMILDILRKSNSEAPILVIGLYNPFPEGGDKIEPLFDEWNKATIELLKSERNVTYIPTNDLFKGKEKKQYFSDALHLNKNGYELLEERILQEYSFGNNK
ncbi:GDSL-type esterase/lipase family protein [Bacillus sp. B-jedd]|uniref:GDSL-type esterase/lipase family protein n=1 Tax=Bacillus sp. B-jedd TaxID=1476857 RepID=UPI0005156C4A|nr:GDSL-type esterase/lipase family protein [Bacillus sp. B-jedd]CEG26992.1 GDSL-like lipase/acylhydrolase [Bacillus sp. B-jedd]